MPDAKVIRHFKQGTKIFTIVVLAVFISKRWNFAGIKSCTEKTERIAKELRTFLCLKQARAFRSTNIVLKTLRHCDFPMHIKLFEFIYVYVRCEYLTAKLSKQIS